MVYGQVYPFLSPVTHLYNVAYGREAPAIISMYNLPTDIQRAICP
jgi:hypothetical protein